MFLKSKKKKKKLLFGFLKIDFKLSFYHNLTLKLT